jgi:hypothetical protein
LADVASKQQTTALFLSTIVTRTRKHRELTEKLTNLMVNLCCAREHSVQFFVQFFYSVKLYSFNDEENNQQNALINSSIKLLMSDHSNMFRLPSWSHHQGVQSCTVLLRVYGAL